MQRRWCTSLLLVCAAGAGLTAAPAEAQTCRAQRVDCYPAGTDAALSCASASFPATNLYVGNSSVSVTLLNQPVLEYSAISAGSQTVASGGNLTLAGYFDTSIGTAYPTVVAPWIIQFNRAGWYDVDLLGSPAASLTNDAQFYLSKVGSSTVRQCWGTELYAHATYTYSIRTHCVFYAALNDQYTIKFASAVAPSGTRTVSAQVYLARLVT